MKLINVIPPVYFYACLALVVVLHIVLPVKHILIFPWRLLGAVPVIAGTLLAVLADRNFKKVGTTVMPLGETTRLVTTGMFRISRHPMYLGFVLFLLGVAMLLGSLTPFVLTALFAILIDVVFVRFEENKMEKRFGQAWLEYKRRVRRWL